jgi:LmbE family N-acetylglucosaminyl deacetylase
MGILAIVAHPDDESFGCGGILALHSKLGYSTAILSLSGKPPRDDELRKAAAELGVKEVFVLDYADFALDMSLVSEVIAIIQKVQPDIVITMNTQDYHRDHRMTAQIAKEAIEWASHVTQYGKKAWRVKRFFHLEGHNLFNQPSVLVDISSVIEQKRKAIAVYNSQHSKFKTNFYMKYALARAAMRGCQANTEFAEALLEEPILHNGPFYEINSVKDLLGNKK